MRTLTRVAASAGALALVTGAIELLKGHVPVLSLAVLYLLAIIPVAVAWGIVYAVGTAIASMLVFNFFFVPPLYTLTLQDTRNWFALLVFLVTAVVVSELATRSRRRAEEAEAAFRELREVTEERERLAEEALEAEALRRSDALKTALLRAVAHDLRSPLMAILTSAGALASPSSRSTPTTGYALAETIHGEASRLDRVVSNCSTSRASRPGRRTGASSRAGTWTSSSARRLPASSRGGSRDGSCSAETPPVEVDAAQVERVLANLRRECAPLLTAGLAGAGPSERGDRLGAPVHVIDRDPGYRTSSGTRCSNRSAAARPAATRLRPRPRDRAWVRGGERRTALGAGRSRRRRTSCFRCRSPSDRRQVPA